MKTALVVQPLSFDGFRRAGLQPSRASFINVYSPNQIITGMAMDGTDSYVLTGVWQESGAEVRKISLADSSYSIVANGLALPTRVARCYCRLVSLGRS